MPQTEVVITAYVHSMEEARQIVESAKRMEKECSCHCTLHIQVY